MSAMNVYTSKNRHLVLLCGFFILFLAGRSMALRSGPVDCEKTTPMDHGTAWVQDVKAKGGSCFETFVPETAILMLEVTVPPSARLEPRLDFFGRLCGGAPVGPDDFRYLDRLPTSLLVEVRAAGDYTFCVEAQDPERALSEFKLISGYAEARTAETKEGDPMEEEIEPDPFVFEFPSRTARSRVCDLSDDHSDTFRCATSISLGDVVTAEIRYETGSDDDVFSFVLDDLQTVGIETAGDAAPWIGLYDRYGHRLHVIRERSGTTDRRIVKTLSPGRYFVRVTHRQQAAGPYHLSVTTPEPRSGDLDPY